MEQVIMKGIFVGAAAFIVLLTAATSRAADGAGRIAAVAQRVR
jgi:hypothetical protein